MKSCSNSAEQVFLVDVRARVQRAVRRICPPWLESSCDDLVQAATLRIIELKKKSEGDLEFSSSYLQRVAYTVLVDEIRRRRRLSEVPFEVDKSESEESQTHFPSLLPTGERRLDQRQLGQAIMECMTSLKAERRQALVLFLQGYTVPETARLLGWSQKKTENLVYRGKADLQQCLKRKGITP